MYCGQALPPSDDALAPAPLSEAEREKKAERARALLDGLTPAARAMMPADVLSKLEQDSEWESSLPASAPPIAGPTGPRLVFSAPPEQPVAVPAAPASSLPTRPLEELSSHSVADLPPANEEEGRGSLDANLLEALGRGGGPFGPRKSPWRLMLLPSPRYRQGLPWLRSRLARTIGVDLYTATQHLQKQLPTCLAVADTHRELASTLSELRDAELDVLVLERREWARDRLPRLVSDIVDLDEDPLLFIIHDDDPVAVSRRSIHAALLAEVAPIRDAVTIEKNRFGIPLKGPRPSLEDRFMPYIAVDLLLDDDPRPLRLRSTDFDFAALLGAQRQIAATLNMREIVRRLSPTDGPIQIDEGFRRVPVLAGPQEREQGGSLKPGTVSRRAVDFTEFVLLRSLSLHPL